MGKNKKLENIKSTPTRQEIMDRVAKEYKKISTGKLVTTRDYIDLELKRLNTVYNVVKEKLSQIVACHKNILRLDQFYKDLIQVSIGLEEYKKALREIEKSKRIVRNLWSKYKMVIKDSKTIAQARKARKEGIGRILSVVNRKSRYIDFLREVVKYVKKLPEINFSEKTILVAGVPQAGKSTLVREISTAKPKIASYPFTTKEIIVGHLELSENLKVQVIDTPGLLDRPLSERNKIELQAVMALKHLSDIVLFLVDVSKASYYSLEEQMNVLEEILSKFKPRVLIPVISKIDITEDELIEKVKLEVLKRVLREPLLISIAKKEGINVLLRELEKTLSPTKA